MRPILEEVSRLAEVARLEDVARLEEVASPELHSPPRLRRAVDRVRDRGRRAEGVDRPAVRPFVPDRPEERRLGRLHRRDLRVMPPSALEPTEQVQDAP